MTDAGTSPAETATAILVAHQRRDIGSCLCGWAELGRSHPGHQVQMLAGAGVLAVAPAVHRGVNGEVSE